jgi:tRNA (cytidine56-2'-O)-methyltransferase
MITVLRLGHRPGRDKRITTHVALVARCLGADRMIITRKDEELAERVKNVAEKFGGDFRIEFQQNWHELLRKPDWVKVHLTMYGERLSDAIPRIPKDRDLVVIVGAEKVPSFVYEMADFNVAVGNQPHSEVAALALFLDRYTEGKWEKEEMAGRLKIIPSDRGKKVVRVR